MRILVFPKKAIQATSNPYCKLLYDNMRECGVDVEEFSVSRVLWGKYEMFHLHWPEYYLNQRWPKAILGIPFCLTVRSMGALARNTSDLDGPQSA